MYESHDDKYGPEVKLLLACAQTCLGSASVERIRALLEPDINWLHQIQLALAHGVMPLLYQSLNATCPEAVPKDVLDQLRHQFHANALRNRFYTNELLKLLSLLDEHGIPAIPYKGPVLAALAYGDPALRQFSDLDILIRESDIPRAKELLLAQGYRPKTEVTGAKQPIHPQTQREYQFVRDDVRVMVELQWRIAAHWQISFSFPLDLESLWERVELKSIAGSRIRSLPPEDLLLILCVHGSCHHWMRLGLICDVAELIRVNKAMDWEQVMKQAKKLGGERMLFLGLRLAQELLGAPLTEEIRQRVDSDPAVTSLAAQVREWLFRQHDGSIGLLEESVFFIKMRECWRDRVPYYLVYLRAYFHATVTPTSKDQAFLTLPASLSFLYYLVRPIRLIVEYGLSSLTDPLKHLLGSEHSQ